MAETPKMDIPRMKGQNHSNQVKKNLEQIEGKKLWLPYLAAILGIFLTILLWYMLLFDVQWFTGISPGLETYHPWVVLIFGILASILVAFALGLAQIARHRALSLKKINEDLKKEITERINAEGSKQKLEMALHQGQKLQAMGTLAGGIAHDFNNLLYAIIGYVEMGREDLEKDSLTSKNLAKVLEACHRGQELVSRILAFSRRQHHQFEPIDIKAAIEAALSLLKPTIPASVMIEFAPEVDMKIYGNQTQIHQVLVNIINNAVDAMDGEGIITIHLTLPHPNDPALQHLAAATSKNYCKIEIADTGHGMDPHIMERIFEPFYTTKEVGKGTGLGLSIVHSIIKDHEGEITVTSSLGRGTTFTIFLPEYESE